jgi:cell division protein FtsB
MTQKQKENYLLFKNTFQEELDGVIRSKKRNYLDYIKLLNKVIIFFIIFNAAYFALNVNDLSIKGYVLNSKKMELDKLVKENKNLELEITRLSSLDNIEKRALAMKLVKVDKIDYIEVKDEAVARK